MRKTRAEPKLSSLESGRRGWKLCVTIWPDFKHAELVSSSLHFATTLAVHTAHGSDSPLRACDPP